MPTFTYEAMNNVGQPVKGEVEAGTSEEAISKVRAMGNFPTKIKEKAAKRAAKSGGAQAGQKQQRKRAAGKAPRKLLTQFTRQLATLVDAGLPIVRSLRILEEQQKPGMMRVATRLVGDDVEAGSTLSEAMSRHPKTFDRLYVNMVRAGELGGVLDVVLRRLADHQERSMALRRKVIGALIYPIAVIVFAFGIVMGLMTFVVPKFSEIFAGVGTELPGPTKVLMGISNWITQDFGWLIIIGIPIGMIMLFRLLKVSQGGRYFVDNLKLHVPLFGGLVSKISVARFTQTLGTLLAAGVPILEALNITRLTAGNEVYSKALAKVHDGIREGESFAEPLRNARIVDPMVTNMIDVGEETGELDKMLNRVAENYTEQVETTVASMVSMLEPALVIILGLIVGGIVVCMFLPMVHLIQTLQK